VYGLILKQKSEVVYVNGRARSSPVPMPIREWESFAATPAS